MTTYADVMALVPGVQHVASPTTLIARRDDSYLKITRPVNFNAVIWTPTLPVEPAAAFADLLARARAVPDSGAALTQEELDERSEIASALLPLESEVLDRLED